MKKTAICFAVLLVLGSAALAGAGSESKILRVIVNRANVRLEPDVQSQVIAVLQAGTLLEYTARTDEWYRVTLPAGEQEQSLIGYIHQSVVQTVESKSDFKDVDTNDQVPAPPRVQRSAPTEPEAPPQDRGTSSDRAHLFSGWTLKIGWMRSPKAGGFGDTWLASVGYDFGIRRNFAVGFEIMPSYHSYPDIGLKVIPVLAFANFKAGFSAGDLIKFLRFMNLFAGAGAGAEASFTTISFDDGETVSKFKTHFALHVLFGTEIDLKFVRLLGEYQLVQVSDPNVNPSYWRHYVMFGFRF
jgi:hypothetical protein